MQAYNKIARVTFNMSQLGLIKPLLQAIISYWFFLLHYFSS